MRIFLQTMTRAVLYLLLGVASAALGLLPWLLTGMRLPLQNLWTSATPPDQMPLVLLPYSQYLLTEIAAVIVIGAAIAGVITRMTRPRQPWLAVAAVITGVLGLQIAATIQSVTTVANGLLKNVAAELYLSALQNGTIASIMVGVLVTFLIARAPAAGAVLGASLAAVAFDPWLTGIMFPITEVNTPNAFTLGLIKWAPAVVLGLTIAWAGLATIGRVLAAVFGLLVLWVGPALFAGISVAAGSRVLAYQPLEMLKLGAEVSLDMLDVRTGSLTPLIVAIAFALLGIVLQRKIQRRKLLQPST